MLLRILFFIQFFSLLVCYPQKYKKITHTTDQQAICLNGSPPALFVHQGNEPQKILIYLEGGGFCQGFEEQEVVEHCYQRSKTKFGSSNLWQDEVTGQGILSTDVHRNKFAQWTKIILAYCDSSMYQGHRQKPVIYNDTALYLKGQKIMKAQIRYIEENYKLSKAKKVVWSGSSAGAVGAAYWSKYIQQLVENKNEIYFIIDSVSSSLDIALDGTHSHLLKIWLKNLYLFTKKEQKEYLNEECMQFYQQKPWICYLIQFNYQFLKGKFIFIDSLYDSWLLSNILNKKCVNFQKNSFAASLHCSEQDMISIQKTRNIHTDLFSKILKKSDRMSVWAISCSNHVYINDQKAYNSNRYRVPEHKGLTVKEAIQAFVFEGKRIIAVDDKRYPNNKGCAYFDKEEQDKRQDL